MHVGVDAVSIDRVAALVARSPRFVARVFTEGEQRDCAGKPQRWASSWAAKEAVRKLFAASGHGLPAFRDVEVVRNDVSGPTVQVRGAATSVAVSLTHEGGLAVAVAAGEPERLAEPDASESLVLPRRPEDGHKGTFGRVLVVAGSRGYTGAPQLTALGAARAGAGLVSLCVPEAIYPIVAAGLLEVMPSPLPDDGTGVLRPQGLDALRERLPTADVLVIGPGLGRSAETEDALLDLLRRLPCPAVVDADALNIVAHRRFDWRSCGQPVVITPHPAEMGRLARVETAVVQSDRQGTAAGYARDNGVVVVLKGAGTVVAGADGRIHLDAHHVVALASGGTGDVLAGLIGGLLAQGLAPFDAAVAGVAIHAEAGLIVQARRGRAGGLASDVLDALPAAQERLRVVIERRSG